jgi:predicted ATPase
MYLRKLWIKNLKLLRHVELDFTDEDGGPRPFTVFVGENGLCKTSLLQAIALAGSGVARANQLAEAASYADLRQPEAPVEIKAEFSFGEKYHADRVYPGHEDIRLARPPRLLSHLSIDPGFDLFRGVSTLGTEHGAHLPYDKPRHLITPTSPEFDPLGDARGRNLPDWFIAGYGVGRTLPAPASITSDEIVSPSRDRLLSLFKSRRIIGTGFADILPPKRAEAFSKHLEEAFVEHKILLHARALSLQARGNINSAREQAKAHRLTLALSGRDVDVPTLWLSQGYQSIMAWVADLVGQVWWEAKKRIIPLDEMEGICLVDELDLHLHPVWQTGLVRALKSAFPKIQFIATTHSPMVLPGLRQNEILRLVQNEEGNVEPRLAKDSPALMTGSELYRSFFDIKRVEPQELDDKLFRYATLASYRGRSAKEDKEVHELLEYLRSHGIDPGFEPEPRAARPTAKKRPAGTKRAVASSRR